MKNKDIGDQHPGLTPPEEHGWAAENVRRVLATPGIPSTEELAEAEAAVKRIESRKRLADRLNKSSRGASWAKSLRATAEAEPNHLVKRIREMLEDEDAPKPPLDIREAAESVFNRHFLSSPTVLDTVAEALISDIATTILAERRRAAAVANERGADLLDATRRSLGNFISQAVEALLIEDRIKSGYEPTNSIRIEGFLDD